MASAKEKASTKRKPQRHIVVGQTYNKVKVLEVVQPKPKKYLVECLWCGKHYVTNGQELLKHSTGCPDCRKADKQAKVVEDYRRLNGTRYGYLEILDYAGVSPKKFSNGARDHLARCLCHKCGKETVTTYRRLKSGIKMCQDCSVKQFVNRGIKAIEQASVDGTNVATLRSTKVSTNSTTGHTGVSYRPKNNNYRAYITFQRKQYHLGVYKNIEDAIKARKEAEKRIFGNFLEWYQETYPDRWAKLNKKIKNKNN